VASSPAKPPPGSVADSRHAQEIPVLGSPTDQYDKAFDPPSDPLSNPPAGGVKAVYRDLPLITIQTDWSPDDVRVALRQNMIGMFDRPAQLADACLGDDRVQATFGSLTSALLGCETIFEPANDSRAAREVCDAWVPCWPKIGGYGSLGWLTLYGKMMGWSPAQLVWDTTGDVWKPEARPWHQRYTYYHWTLRRFIALSQDGQIVIEPGDGKWILHAPWGDYRPWVFGCLRAVAQPWLIRHLAYRDWARFSEVHGIPIKRARVPASAGAPERAAFEEALQSLPSETTILMQQGMDAGLGYDLDLLEATDTAWESFPGLIDRCDMSIVLAFLFQNLTTEVQSGSLAATVSHAEILHKAAQREDLAMQTTIRPQVARPFASFNFGDAGLAPKTRYDLQSVEAHKAVATLAAELGRFLQALRSSGGKLRDLRGFVTRMGVPDPGEIEDVDPVTVEAKLAGASGVVSEATDTKAPKVAGGGGGP
jgi:hypothetical protein